MQWIDAQSTNKSVSTNGTNGLQLPKKNANIVLDDNSRTILEKRYLRRGEDGKPGETVEEMFDRIATCVAEPDIKYGTQESTQIKFINFFSPKKFSPTSPTFPEAA